MADLRGIWERGPNARLVTGANIAMAWGWFTWACEVHAKIAAGDAALEELRHLRADD